MPYIEGMTPVCMDRPDVRRWRDPRTGLERRDGIFRSNEAALSPFDHGNLYGDGVFEGIRMDERRILMLREHIDRWFHSARRLQLTFPYTRDELARILVDLVRETMGREGQSCYIRPVLTRGLGDLGVGPFKCPAPSLYILCASVLLYPRECYENGIDVAFARTIRRNDPTHLDPNIKTNNYLNNVLALLETRASGALETIMLTNDGYVAEASADNIFVAETLDNRPRLLCPAPQYALIGLTRNLVIEAARSLGFDVVESATILPSDLTGPSREVFITGTACGLMPISHVDGLPTAPPSQRPLLKALRSKLAILRRMSRYAFAIDADDPDALTTYMREQNFCAVEGEVSP